MKTCVEWRKSFKYMNQVDEFNIQYKPDKNDKLLDFLAHYAIDKRVNIYTSNNQDYIDLLIAIAETGKYNIAIVIKEFNKQVKEKFKNNNIKWYFSQPVGNWEKLNEIIDFGCSDVFITGELGFDLEKVAAVASGKIQTRAIVNLSQYYYGNSLTGFFIRPEDVDFYSKYIDIYEFFDVQDKQNVFYDIYFHDKEWNGNLREIIKHLDIDLNNYYLIDDEFAKRRIKCKKECIKGEKCKLCMRLKELADTIENSPDYELYTRRVK